VLKQNLGVLIVLLNNRHTSPYIKYRWFSHSWSSALRSPLYVSL
jgi:hypothetical protein